MSEPAPASRRYVVFRLPRELDLYNAESVKKKLTSMVESPAAAVVIDCTALAYLDSSGVGVLIHAHTRLSRARKPFCFAGLKGPAAQVVKLTALDGVFPLEDSLDDAESYMKRILTQ